MVVNVVVNVVVKVSGVATLYMCVAGYGQYRCDCIYGTEDDELSNKGGHELHACM